ncbi:MAG: dipeptide epimerase [Hyphomicrobiaceae bacterium]|nr:dipeptide epimerase [Hyphomicrobiaceae bacterium]
MKHRISVAIERHALAEAFVISRGAKTEAEVIVVTIEDGDGHAGRGEAVPYARYGESVTAAAAAITAYDGPLDRAALAQRMPAGAARNALDCALWDLEAKATGTPVHACAGLPAPHAVTTAYTLSLAAPEDMAARARNVAHLPLLKLKLGGDGDAARMSAVRGARPDARIIVDANEAWTEAMLGDLMQAAAAAGVELIEQPLPAGADHALAKVSRPVAVCADESAHVAADVAALADRYDAVNIKLDKTGGLTEALAMREDARRAGLAIMIGSMVATSLATAPALLLAQDARWVDLDGPLLLARDRADGLRIENGLIRPASPALWG